MRMKNFCYFNDDVISVVQLHHRDDLITKEMGVVNDIMVRIRLLGKAALEARGACRFILFSIEN